jgi:MoxR-like ATPase
MIEAIVSRQPVSAQLEPALQPAASVERIVDAVGTVVRGKDQVVRLLLTAFFARGHVLIEDVPGVGKTTLARALAACVGGAFRRIQFTSDLLPSDIVGVTVYDQAAARFEFRPGPIFANIVLADEINRSSPRTQSALMEALNEGQVTVDDQTHPIEDPYLVIATQNPAEHYGTYPLPESQMDRFLLRVVIGYPPRDEERRVVAQRGGYDPIHTLRPVTTVEEVRAIQRQVDGVKVDPALLDYTMTVVEQTRQSPLLGLGVSTRGAIAWYRAAQAHALVAGRDYCLPDDFKQIALAVLAHRVVLAGPQESLIRSRKEAERIISEVLERVAIPL